MYIRALAIFDLMGLLGILVYLLSDSLPYYYPIVFFRTYVAEILMNSFLVAGLYCAVLLTVERYWLIHKPHKKRLFSIEKTVIFKIIAVLLLSILLHTPMILQNTIKTTPSGLPIKGNNRKVLCKEPWWTIFAYYKMCRETLRLLCVALLVSLNIIIAKKLQIAKKNRRMLIKRSSTTVNECPELVVNGANKEKARNLMKSFTEKKLTALMIAICFIYVIGNIPQIGVMILQNESVETMYSFQMFRQIANTFEVLNHCINFFIFCMASSEYTRAFLLYCTCLRRLLLSIPACATIIHKRRLTSLFEGKDITEASRRRSSNYFIEESVIPIERRDTVCMLLSTSESKSSTTFAPPKAAFNADDCLVLRNTAVIGSSEIGDVFL
uniref:G-protein coupled receptors family 1 profile domain-containing protein n=2 Tax=Acrobeloides nanus TaxID=290746 RepID=A0A914D041_9BILA